MVELIMTARFEDEQISILAAGLGYKSDIKDGMKQIPKTEIMVNEASGEEEEVRSVEVVDNMIPNPITDDEFIRNFFQKTIGDVATEIFAKNELDKLDEQRKSILAGVGANINAHITTEKK